MLCLHNLSAEPYVYTTDQSTNARNKRIQLGRWASYGAISEPINPPPTELVDVGRFRCRRMETSL